MCVGVGGRGRGIDEEGIGVQAERMRTSYLYLQAPKSAQSTYLCN